MRAVDVIPPDATEPVETRPLISMDEAGRLARLFKIFANETRLRLLHVLVREGEVCAGDLAQAVEMKPQAVSNQLQRLVDRGILAPQRDGTSIYYHIIDPCVPVLLERGLCLTECCLEGAATTSTEDCCDQSSAECRDRTPKKNRSSRNGRKDGKQADRVRGQSK